MSDYLTPTDPCLLDAVDQRALLVSGELSAAELLAAHRDRIERLDVEINAIPTRSWQVAEREAAARDQAFARGERGEQLPPLHGLVIAYKDLHDTAGVRTTYGSPVYADHVPVVDDPLVARLRSAGAVMVGKTNTPEFGAGSHTFNPVLGTTRNPWDVTRSAGGSSGGAAAGVAARMLSIADGSDVGGSLRNPPAFCGVVGLRPSLGRIPLIGPGHQHQRFRAYGPIGRSVGDVALGLSAMAGPDPLGLLSLAEPGSTFAPPLPPLSPLSPLSPSSEPARSVRVAYSEDLGGLPLEPAVRAAVRAAADALASAGWLVEEATPPLGGVDDCFERIRAWMFAADPGGRLGADRHRVKATVQQEIADGERLTGADLSRAFAAETRLALGARQFFRRYDLLLTPTTQVLPFAVEQEWVREIDRVTLHRYTDWMRICSRLTVLDVPVLSLPIGTTVPTPTAPAGLPVGVQLAAAPGADLRLLQLAAAVEAVLGRLGPPPLG